MKTTWVIATMAIMYAGVQPIGTAIDTPLVRQASGLAVTLAASSTAASGWNGRWEGTTVSGSQLVLILQLQGQRVTGRLIVGKQTANIVYGKVVEDAFALTTEPIDGHSVDATGRLMGDAIELSIEGVKKPVTLTRAQ